MVFCEALEIGVIFIKKKRALYIFYLDIAN